MGHPVATSGACIPHTHLLLAFAAIGGRHGLRLLRGLSLGRLHIDRESVSSLACMSQAGHCRREAGRAAPWRRFEGVT